MRVHKESKGITVNAISGTHIVFLGMNLKSLYKKGFRGFAIHRTDLVENESYWLRGLKAFEITNPDAGLGETFSTQKQPIQSFQWADYSAKPGYRYRYKITCMYGEPTNLEARRDIEVLISTEIETGPKHSVFFNRGSVATQEYARKFQNLKPSDYGRAAYTWLSRGMLESIVNFIDRSKNGDFLKGAVYEFQYGTTNEFQYSDIMKSLRAAKQRGVEVDILFDDREKYRADGKADGPFEKNREAIDTARIKQITHGRGSGKLMHNKFIVLGRGNHCISVLTGSTNQTENGIFGHSNLVHIVEDPEVADSFMRYWERLKLDPIVDSDYREANMAATPVPVILKKGTTTIFSPRTTKLDSLKWYAALAAGAKKGLFMTFAFGMHELFKEVYRKDDEVLRMSLMEKAFRSPSVKEIDEKDIQKIRNRPNVIVAIGNRIRTNSFDRWLAEIDRIIPQLHVYWIHTKYMVIDPLGPEPIVVSGSANFSEASTDTNDENMLIIKGDKRIADIYFCEYMRLFSHYSFREAVKWAMEKEGLDEPQQWTPQFLDPTDTWIADYYDKKGKQPDRYFRRVYFSGEMSV